MTTHNEPNYSEFATLPLWTQAQWGPAADGDRELLNESDPFKWSGDAAPPAIGARVKCYMNALGMGTVLGYFTEYGWLGVLVQLDKNPKWRKQQNKGKNPPAHLFGIDLQPRAKPVPTMQAAAETVLGPVTDAQEAAMVRAHRAGVAYADRADACPDGAAIIARGLAPREHEAFAAGYIQATKRKLKV